ncbi:hypothetical protein EIN_268540 [Entamoeba invadens IP1]|uniref:Uncharacterized protein n=1 Tax=Entamoeba invadens IP1 TaxID=370355 RepID=A0A0A1U869_ENTIV|nr:hypothetical protein EIN_268540 [Entamoeba invadens IP1]ELP91098.1 hypothetical protein EIN_268540 [Entamoeba invadens IP1]|eukprot:XP_004257869.1 hypothetical protein EIN_268540 [Entamoeba invadens IP1]
MAFLTQIHSLPTLISVYPNENDLPLDPENIIHTPTTPELFNKTTQLTISVIRGGIAVKGRCIVSSSVLSINMRGTKKERKTEWIQSPIFSFTVTLPDGCYDIRLEDAKTREVYLEKKDLIVGPSCTFNIFKTLNGILIKFDDRGCGTVCVVPKRAEKFVFSEQKVFKVIKGTKSRILKLDNIPLNGEVRFYNRDIDIKSGKIDETTTYQGFQVFDQNF